MPAEIVLPQVLDIQQAEPLRTELLGLRGQSVALDGAAVERLGGLCLQVLLAARKTWAGDGQSLTLRQASDAFTHHWNTFGADPWSAEEGEPA